MGDNEYLKKIEKRLKKLEKMLDEKLTPFAGIEAHLGDLVNRPAPLKTMEARLEVAEKAKSEVEAEIIAEETEEKEVLEVKAPSTSAVPTVPKDIQKGVWVEIHTDHPQHAAKSGLKGQVVSRSKAWATVQVANSNAHYKKGKTLSIPPKYCMMLEHGENVLIENDLAPIPSLEYTQVEDSDHCGNYRVESGMHKGKSYHLLYNEADRGPGVLDFIAFKSAHSKEGRINCAEYLLLRNYKDSRYVTDIEGWLKEEKED